VFRRTLFVASWRDCVIASVGDVFIANGRCAFEAMLCGSPESGDPRLLPPGTGVGIRGETFRHQNAAEVAVRLIVVGCFEDILSMPNPW